MKNRHSVIDLMKCHFHFSRKVDIMVHFYLKIKDPISQDSRFMRHRQLSFRNLPFSPNYSRSLLSIIENCAAKSIR